VTRKVFEDWNAFLDLSPQGTPSDDIVSFRSRVLGQEVRIEPSLVNQPDGIRSAAIRAGIKHEGVLDFTVVRLDEPGAAAALFTQSLCPSYAVQLGRESLADGRA
jgi:hypothetical protein